MTGSLFCMYVLTVSRKSLRFTEYFPNSKLVLRPLTRFTE